MLLKEAKLNYWLKEITKIEHWGLYVYQQINVNVQNEGKNAQSDFLWVVQWVKALSAYPDHLSLLVGCTW